jgi:hypothetical protein
MVWCGVVGTRGRVIARACLRGAVGEGGRKLGCGVYRGVEPSREAVMTEPGGGAARAEKRGTSEIVTWRRVHSCRLRRGFLFQNSTR